MLHGRLVRVDTGACVVARLQRTETIAERMRGLLGRTELAADAGLLITQCGAVHTLGMRYALDLIYLSRDWQVKKLVRRLTPWRFSACPGASMVIELPAGRLDTLQLSPGMPLRWESLP